MPAPSRDDDLAAQVAQIDKAFTDTLEHDTGQWILSSRHQHGACELAVSGLVAVNSLMAMAGGILAALVAGKNDPGFLHNGPLAGLVAITAEPLAPTPLWETLVGVIGGILVVFSIVTLDKLKVDDPVGR